jgi:hypothetical protein
MGAETRTSNRQSGDSQQLQPEAAKGNADKAGDAGNGYDPYKDNKAADPGAYFEAPELKLFNPKDRTAKRTSVAPVRTAVYEQPVRYRQTTASAPQPRKFVSDEQARIDSMGWTSAAK